MRNFLSVPLLVFLTGISFSQQSKKSSAPLGVFAYASTPTHLVAVSNELDASQANRLNTAVCPTNKISSGVRLAPISNPGDPRFAFEYDADSEVPAGNYCLLVDEKSHQNLFTWGSGDEPLLLHLKGCRGEFTQAAESMVGRTARDCYLIGGYGTGLVGLVEYVSDSPENRLAALVVTDCSLDDARYSIALFPAGSPVWTVEKDGKFRPERFRHLFTISDDPDSKVWTIAVEWDGPSGHDLTLYQPKDAELRPVLVSRDPMQHHQPTDDVASR